MRNEPCQIGSIRPRRQALERRTLHPTRPTVPSGKQWFQSSNNWLSRFVNLHTRRWRGQMQKTDKPDWLHKSTTPSPRATYTPDFQIHKPNFPRRFHNNFPKLQKVYFVSTLPHSFFVMLFLSSTFPLKGCNHGFDKLCPKGLDTLEIKYFCGALGGGKWCETM